MLYKTNIVGAVSEAMVSGYLASQGCEVFSAAQSHSRADLVYIKEARAVRVQVKTSSVGLRGKVNYEQCRLVRKGINTPYSLEEVDEIWIVGTHLWCFPLEDVQHMTSITLLNDNLVPRKTVRDYDPNNYIVVKGSFERPYKDRLFSHDNNPSLLITNKGIP